MKFLLLGTRDANDPHQRFIGIDRAYLFLQGNAANEKKSPRVIDTAANAILTYRQAILARGSRFLFMPIPNKENIYFDKLVPVIQPTFLQELTAELRKHGVEVLDVETAFRCERKRNPQPLFFYDDTHWNPHGVRVAVSTILPANLQDSPAFYSSD